MLLNPLINVALALVSLILGTVVLINTNNWWFMIPCLFFMLLFVVSLLRPIPTKIFVPYRIERKPRKPLVKLTAGRLHAISASRSPFPTPPDNSRDLSHPTTSF